MSFLGSAAGPEWPSVVTGIFSITVFEFLFIYFFIISNYSTTLSSGANWGIIDKPPVF